MKALIVAHTAALVASHWAVDPSAKRPHIPARFTNVQESSVLLTLESQGVLIKHSFLTCIVPNIAVVNAVRLDLY